MKIKRAIRLFSKNLSVHFSIEVSKVKNGLLGALVAVMIMFLPACSQNTPSTEPTQLVSFDTEAIETEAPETKICETIAAKPVHSRFYIPGVSVEDVILYFNEVCLDSEIINVGDPSYVQKWTVPIYYTLNGDYTDTDLAVLTDFEVWLNSIEGFPGIFPVEDLSTMNLRIHFCDQEELLLLMGPDFDNTDGAVTFWYDNNEIYDAIICYRTDLDQHLRNSVILEEIYNGLGPIQDTSIRPDSIIYQEFSQPQWLSSIDELLLQLLYHPDIQPGMDAQQCEEVIRRLYY